MEKVILERTQEVARHILRFFDIRNIVTLKDLEPFNGKLVQMTSDATEHILVSCRKQEITGKPPYQIEYISSYYQGTLMDVRVYPERSLTHIILKNEMPLQEYAPFVRDTFGNIVQNRAIRDFGIDVIRREMEYLKAMSA